MKQLTEKENITYDYHSTQIDLPHQKHILQYCNSLIPNSLIYTEEDDSSYGREDEPHITVLYGLHEEVTPEDVQNIIYGNELETFHIMLGGISSFRIEDKPYDVLKIDIISPELEKLHYLIEEKLPNSNTFPEYKPHFTIAYIKKGTCKKLEKEYDFSGEKILIKKFMFSPIKGDKVPVHLY